MRSIILLALLTACGGSTDVKPPAAPVTGEHEDHEAAENEVGPDGPTDLSVPTFGAIPTDADSIAKGQAVFDAKGCGGCHAFGKKVVGPDLLGVGDRRSPTWIGRMVLHPEQMTKEDPTAKGLYRTLMVQMTNQGVPEADLPYLIAYITSQKPK
jgi:mono/diheme cytochrome c family protein